MSDGLLKEVIVLNMNEADESISRPASFIVIYEEGKNILFDQHRLTELWPQCANKNRHK